MSSWLFDFPFRARALAFCLLVSFTFAICRLTKGFNLVTDGEGNSPLQVLAWPYHGRPGKVNIQRDSPASSDAWVRAQITFRKVDNFFVILFRATSPTLKKLYIALDDVSVQDGPCV